MQAQLGKAFKVLNSFVVNPKGGRQSTILLGVAVAGRDQAKLPSWIDLYVATKFIYKAFFIISIHADKFSGKSRLCN